MKKYGMFKALICGENEEFSFPFIPEKYFMLKKGSFILLSVVFLYLLINPPVAGPGVIQLNGVYKIDQRVDEFGMTRLHRAVICGKEKIVGLLIRNHADPNAVDNYGWSPLHWSNFLGRDDISGILVSGGAKRDVRSTENWFIFKKGSLPDELKRQL